MNDSLDQFWNSVLAADAPTVEEMARAEANLRAIGPAPKLPQEQIDAMVRTAVQATELPPMRAVPAVRSRQMRLFAMAALLMVSMSVAWIVTARPLWNEGTHPVGTMDFVLACRVVSERRQPEESKIAALGIIDYHFAFTIPVLHTLGGENSVEPLRSQAHSIRDRLVALLRDGADRAPRPVDLRREEVTKAALDTELNLEARRAALTHLGYLSEEALLAVLQVELATNQGRLLHDTIKKGWAKELSR